MILMLKKLTEKLFESATTNILESSQDAKVQDFIHL